MNHGYGWMGGGMWVWTAVGIAIIFLLAVAVSGRFKK